MGQDFLDFKTSLFLHCISELMPFCYSMMIESQFQEKFIYVEIMLLVILCCTAWNKRTGNLENIYLEANVIIINYLKWKVSNYIFLIILSETEGCAYFLFALPKG